MLFWSILFSVGRFAAGGCLRVRVFSVFFMKFIACNLSLVIEHKAHSFVRQTFFRKFMLADSRQWLAVLLGTLLQPRISTRYERAQHFRRVCWSMTKAWNSKYSFGVHEQSVAVLQLYRLTFGRRPFASERKPNLPFPKWLSLFSWMSHWINWMPNAARHLFALRRHHRVGANDGRRSSGIQISFKFLLCAPN